MWSANGGRLREAVFSAAASCCYRSAKRPRGNPAKKGIPPHRVGFSNVAERGVRGTVASLWRWHDVGRIMSKACGDARSYFRFVFSFASPGAPRNIGISVYNCVQDPQMCTQPLCMLAKRRSSVKYVDILLCMYMHLYYYK